MDENNFFEKCVLELCRTAMIKPRQIERSGFFLLDHNGQTWIYRLVSGQSDAWLWRNRDFPTEDDDLEKCALELFWTATIKPRQIERSGLFLLNHNGQTWIYRLVSGQSDVRLWRNRDFPTEDDDLENCALEPQLTNLNLQTGLRSIGYLVVEKSRFSDRGWCVRPPPPKNLSSNNHVLRFFAWNVSFHFSA